MHLWLENTDLAARYFASADELSIDDLKSVYRLLGSYRGLSEAGIDFRRSAADIDWAQWQEARF